MNGARMRSYSLSGTRPEKINRSVPRLSALATAVSRTSPSAGFPSVSLRISAFPGCRRTRAPRRPSLKTQPATDDLELDTLKTRRPPISGCPAKSTNLTPMSESTLQTYALPAPENSLTGRRIFFALVVLASMIGLTWLLAFALSAGGFGVLDFILVVLFAVTLPWSVIGFWNATFGLFIMRSADPVGAVTPVSARVTGDEPITAKTAILWCVRNEDAARVIRNIEPMMEGIVASGFGAQFRIFILSDTNMADHAVDEEAQFATLRSASWEGRLGVTYRRRTDNTGFKAGNVFDFCTRWGGDYEFAVTLDADSFQTAESILRMVRIMQIDPRLGILQSLVVGMPSTSAFARIFQFGMRLGMRSYTLGSAWWQGDCGPYWGHNAILRLAPFIAHCHLPPRPDGTHILSHDQIEAVLMRRAGFEVRVLPEEGASWEENPPTLLEFIRRDLRWAQGNMQYWPYLVMDGLKPVSRYQIGFAMLMFLGSPAWIGLLVLGARVQSSPRASAGVHPSRCRHGAVYHHADHVVRAQDRDRPRRDLATEAARGVRRRGPLRCSRPSPRRSSSWCCRRSCGSATRCFSSA